MTNWWSPGASSWSFNSHSVNDQFAQSIFQWFICTRPKARLCQKYKIHTVQRYFEKCFFKLTGWQDCIAFPSSYTRNKGFSFVSSLGMAVIFLIIECPWILASSHCKSSDCIHSSWRINFLNNCSLEPENHWVYLYQTAWKSKQTCVGDFEIIISLIWQKLNLVMVWKPLKNGL